MTGSDNLDKFIAEMKSGKSDLSHVRTALRLEFNHHETTSSQIRSMAKKTEGVVKDLWEPYEEKSFAREMVSDKDKWDEDYFDSQVVYLKTNFSRKRFDHLLAVKDKLHTDGVKGF